MTEPIHNENLEIYQIQELIINSATPATLNPASDRRLRRSSELLQAVSYAARAEMEENGMAVEEYGDPITLLFPHTAPPIFGKITRAISLGAASAAFAHPGPTRPIVDGDRVLLLRSAEAIGTATHHSEMPATVYRITPDRIYIRMEADQYEYAVPREHLELIS